MRKRKITQLGVWREKQTPRSQLGRKADAGFDLRTLGSLPKLKADV